MQRRDSRHFTPTSSNSNAPIVLNSSSEWKQWLFVRVYLRNLPLGITTLDIYNNLVRYGNITKISILESREDYRTVRAEVTFAPPPSSLFWGRDITFRINNVPHTIRISLAHDQRKDFTVASPTRSNVVYQERTELSGWCLEFGVLQGPASMLVMASRGDLHNPVKMILNLRHKEIHVHFPSLFKSDRSSAMRQFRFFIAIDEDFQIWKLPDRSYVIHLKNPPWYSKRLKEAMASSHSSDARFWSEDDSWARQTDICNLKEMQISLQDRPVALRKLQAITEGINIARWTTFRFQPMPDPLSRNEEANVFRAALQDFNVKTIDSKTFKILKAPQDIEQRTWEILNSHTEGKVSAKFDLDFSRIVLPFPVRYQLEVCLSHGWISEYSVNRDFIAKLSQWPEDKAMQALVYVDTYRERIFDPMVLFDDIKYAKPVLPKRLPASCVEIRSATVTATGVVFNTPTVEITNRVVRLYRHCADRFLRVRFQDDNYRGKTRLYPSTNNKMINIYERIRRVMKRGIYMDDTYYEFLAWGNSQLREHGAYFFAKKGDISARSICADLGNFDEEKVVAKRAARMGQCFSTTRQVMARVPSITQLELIPDTVRGRYNFTDGVGRISRQLAAFVASELKIEGEVPSVFQFRLGGCKGVLTIDPSLVGTYEMKIRGSQYKFSSTSKHLEIIRWSEFWHPCLNRQVIVCLSSLGVPNDVFLGKQNDTIEALNAAMEDDEVAKRVLRDSVDPNRMTLVISDLVDAGFRKSKDPFVLGLLNLWRAWSLQYLKDKARIPVKEGAFVLGTVDETGTLRGHFDTVLDRGGENGTSKEVHDLPQIFLQIKDPKSKQKQIVKGVCVLARNPSLHRGDIRIVEAIDEPALRHLVDVVVFPQNGDRDIPSMCSGGDLDGDDYIVIWDKALIPPIWNVEPFHYEPPPPKIAEDHITTNDIIKFFVDYLQNDQLGRIAHAHLAAADFLDDGIDSCQCLELLHLHSRAVDYPKTGVAAQIKRRHERNQWPHFMEKKGKQYKSNKVLGQLYDAVEKAKFEPNYDQPFDKRILLASEPSISLLEEVKTVKGDYDRAVSRILAQHEIKSEFELWSTFVLDHSKKAQDYKFHEEIGRVSRTLKDQYHESLTIVAGGTEFRQLAPVAIAAYRLTFWQVQSALHQVRQGERSRNDMPFISFPWLLQTTLCQIVTQYDKSDVMKRTTHTTQNQKAGENATDPVFDHTGDIDVLLPDNFELGLDAPVTSQYLHDPSQQLHEDKIFNIDEDVAAQPINDSEDSPNQSDISEPSFDVRGQSFGVEQTLLDMSREDACAKLQNGFWDPCTQESKIVPGCDSTVIENAGSADRNGNSATHEDCATYPSPERTDKANVQTCFFWSTAGCKYGNNCKFAHHDTGSIATMQKTLTCYYWKAKGFCHKASEDCLYAHHDTGKVASWPYRKVSAKRILEGVEDELSPFRDLENQHIEKQPVGETSLLDLDQDFDELESTHVDLTTQYGVTSRGSPDIHDAEAQSPVTLNAALPHLNFETDTGPMHDPAALDDEQLKHIGVVIDELCE